jgi:excisionase family DNA binding protein
MRKPPLEYDRLLTVREAAKRLCCSITNVYSLIDRGALPFVSVGNAKGYRIDPADIDAFIQERKKAKRGTPQNGAPPRPRLKHIRF